MNDTGLCRFDMTTLLSRKEKITKTLDQNAEV